MFLAEVAKVLLRRWYLVVLSLGLTGGVGYAAMQAVPPVYAAQAEVLLLPPRTTVGENGNPYLSLGGLTPAGDVLAKALSDPATAAQLKPLGATADYVVELDTDTPAPLVMVTVSGDSAAATLRTLDIVLDRLPPTLLDIQRAANVPTNALISSTEVTRSKEPTVSTKPQLRAMIVAAGGTLVLALLLTAAIDALLRRPRGRHEVPPDAPVANADVANADIANADIADEPLANEAHEQSGPATVGPVTVGPVTVGPVKAGPVKSTQGNGAKDLAPATTHG